MISPKEVAGFELRIRGSAAEAVGVKPTRDAMPNALFERGAVVSCRLALPWNGVGDLHSETGRASAAVAFTLRLPPHGVNGGIRTRNRSDHNRVLCR